MADDSRDADGSFDDVMGVLDRSMIIVTTCGADGERSGCLVGFSTQCSIDPGRFLVCLSRTNHTFAVAQEADFLAAVQVIVYAGAIVVLFLFVLMLLGVDQAEDLSIEPLGGQRIAAVVVGLGVLGLSLLALASTGGEATGARPLADATHRITEGVADIDQLGESLVTDYLFAFEITSVLLVIAIVGAVVMSRKIKRAEYVNDPLEVSE
jgi:NADH-quinone oxidoreductase subunit J